MKRVNRPSRLIALLTDFGSQDAFVGTMKGVILKINPQARIVDLAHDIAPQDVNSAAYALWSSYRFFPEGTIFVAVVDPGVGSDRRILCAQGRRHLFLAPDNGLLKYLMADHEIQRVREVTNSEYFLPAVSSTFHGRDIFAPVAAYLSLGLNPEKLGKQVKTHQSGEEFVYLDEFRKGKAYGKVIYLDRFGNLITNLRISSGRTPRVKKLIVTIGKHVIKGLSKSYAEGSGRNPLALINSANLLEIGLKNGNAAQTMRMTVGEKVTVEFL